MGNRVPIADEEIINYVIDGIPLENLQNQARMNSFTSIPELLKAFQRIKLSDSSTRVAKPEAYASRTARYKHHDKAEDMKASANKEATSGTKSAVREVIKCYHLEEQGYYARDCPLKQKKQGPSKSSTNEKTKTKRADRQVGLVNDDGLINESEDGDQVEDQQCEDQEEEIYLIDVREEM